MTTVNIKTATALVNYEDYAGDTLKLQFNFADVDNVDIDFTGSIVELIIKSKPTDVAALLALSSADGDILLNTVTDSNVYAELTSTHTGTILGAGAFYYWIVVTDSLSAVDTYAAGIITLKAR